MITMYDAVRSWKLYFVCPTKASISLVKELVRARSLPYKYQRSQAGQSSLRKGAFFNYVDKIFGLFWTPTCWKWSGNSFTVEICIPLTFPDCKFQFFYLLFVNVVCERSLRELQYIRSDIIWPFLTYIPLILMSYVTLVVIFVWPLIGVIKY